MPTVMVILFAVTSATSKQPQSAPIAQVRDMDTCKTLAYMLNEQSKDSPDLGFMCREIRTGKA